MPLIRERRPITAKVSAEQPGDIGSRDPRAMVDNRHDAAIGGHRTFDRHASRGRAVLDGIREQIHKHLLERFAPAPDDGRRHRHLDDDPAGGADGRHAIDRGGDDRLDIHGLEVRRLDRLGPGVGEQRFAERLDPHGQVVHRCDRVLQLLSRPLPLHRDVGFEHDRMHGIEHLVGHVGVEP